MASTNKTTYYELSQYIGTDKPTYLGDYNSDMLAIDTGIHGAASNAATALSTANSAASTASDAATAASTATTTANTASVTATEAKTTAETAATNASAALTAAQAAETAAAANTITNLAPAYDPTLTYAVDDLVTYIDTQGSGKLYKCIVAIVSPESFNINKWDDVTTSEAFGRKPEILASVIADGVKTIKDIFDELYNAVSDIDRNKLTHSELICVTSTAISKFICVSVTNTVLSYERTIAVASNQTLQVIYNQLSSDSIQNILNYYNLGTTPTPSLSDHASTVETSGVEWYIKTL